jgi:glycerol-3-phosphate acyltransferase PlsY
MQELLLIIIAYLVGSIPTAVWVSKVFFGVDIRDYGSGNSGATNTYRVLGAKWGTFVMVVDMLKGLLASLLYLLLPYYVTNDFQRTNLMVGLGLAAVIGHIFPVWAKFKGGKGVATLFGMVLAIQPVVALFVAAVFVVVLYLTRFVSLSSILASIAFPILVLVIFNDRNPEPSYRVFAIAVALLVILTHQKNINRLLQGNESKARILKHRDRRKQKQQV